MLFFTIPLSLTLVSIIIIAIIIWRKLPYVKKLTTEGSESTTQSFPVKLFSELTPELIESLDKLKFHEYKEAWLMEIEKFLRRLRLLSLRMDRLSDSLISKVRKGYQTEEDNLIPMNTPGEAANERIKPKEAPVFNELEALKKEEQRLIIEIAKNPKDSKLYDILGDLYVKMGEYNDAKESFEAAIELDSGNENLKKKLSAALEKLGH